MIDNEEEKTEFIPIEVVELIKSKPEITYIMLKITTGYFFHTIKEGGIEDTEIDNVIYNFINQHESNPVNLNLKPEELN